MKIFKIIAATLLLLTLALDANSSKEIDADSKQALEKFYQEVPSGKKFLAGAKAYVIFPDVNEVGFFLAGKYGEGVLIVNGISKSYHSITAASLGFQMGLQNYSLIVAFMSDSALKNFVLDDDSWETDVETKIIMADWTTEDDVAEVDYGTSMVGFVFDPTGMMGKFSLEGTKFERINPDD